MKFGVVVLSGTWSGGDPSPRWGRCWDRRRLPSGTRIPTCGCDCLVLPGGFSYGDYLRAGAVARFAP